MYSITCALMAACIIRKLLADIIPDNDHKFLMDCNKFYKMHDMTILLSECQWNSHRINAKQKYLGWKKERPIRRIAAT